MADKYTVLKEYFGHTDFRHGQAQVVDTLLQGGDALCVMPTGAGKSLCYQVPALLFDGVTLVVSPLISLMKDQVAALVQSGVRAAYLNSSLSFAQLNKALYNMRCGAYKIVYVAPERLVAPDFIEACRHIKISLLAVDEAHCISQWGQDFRPSYLRITDFVRTLGYRPVIGAFTATATAEVKEDIEAALELKSPFKITTGFDRPNLRFTVIRPDTKMVALLELLQERPGTTGIVYCSTRKTVEEVCEGLCDRGYAATMYHAGLPDTVRRDNQEDFVYDRKNIMVATNAFGMGIDKSNVSFVIHYNMPKNIESYYQEAGRAGRDGGNADCVLLYNPSDVRTNLYLIDKSEPNPELSVEQQMLVREKDRERLRQMTFYSTTDNCLRSFILSYFGEKSGDYCGNCSNCLARFDRVDITQAARLILTCIKITGERFGKAMVCDILRGSKNQRILMWSLDQYPTYGALKSYTEGELRAIVDFLEREGYLAATAGDYPLLRTTPKAAPVLHGNVELTMKTIKKQPPKEKKQKVEDSPLLAKLKQLRKELADKKRVPAYIIFSDATLKEMCERLPRTALDFRAISGVGNTKQELYGKQFLALINDHCNGVGDKAPVLVNKTKAPFAISDQQLSRYILSDEPISVTQMVRQINALVEDDGMEKLSSLTLFRWLYDNGLICYNHCGDDTSYAAPTFAGEQIGLILETRQGVTGPYQATLCTVRAQKYLLTHWRDIVG